MSFAQESTRYCNYSKDKFGNELTFIKPTWYNQEKLEAEIASSIGVDSEEIAEQDFNQYLNYCERQYFKLLKKGCKPQEARQVLPNALKTEIIVTGFESDWEHFFSLRSPKAGAQGAHPDIAKLADELYEKLNSVNK
jgi:thymidylate synthase (FAD)